MYWLFCQKKKTSGQPWWVLCTRIHKANLVSVMNKNTEGIYTYITFSAWNVKRREREKIYAYCVNPIMVYSFPGNFEF